MNEPNELECLLHSLNAVPDAWKDEKITVTFEISIRDALCYDNHNVVFEKFWPAYCNSVLIEAHKRGLRSRATTP